MKVMLIYKVNNRQVFIDNAIAVRIECDVRGRECWLIETEDVNRLFPCMDWFVYLHYDQK